MQLATVKVKSDSPLGYVVINQRDFNRSIHTLWDGGAVSSTTAEAAVPAGASMDDSINGQPESGIPDETWAKPSLEEYALSRFGLRLDRRKSKSRLLAEIREAQK
jgi:hypothetical protein